MRPDKETYYLDIARAVAVKDDVIVSTGYNGACRGEPNCSDVGECWRKIHNIPHGEQYEKCKAVHAECNAIINGNREDMKDAVLYLAGYENGVAIEDPEPCLMCSRMIRNARIGMVITG